MFTELLRTEGIWVEWSTSKSGIPEFAVYGGSDQNGSYYVIRAKRENEMIVGKYCPQLKKAYISYGKREYEVDNFEVRKIILEIIKNELKFYSNQIGSNSFEIYLGKQVKYIK